MAERQPSITRAARASLRPIKRGALARLGRPVKRSTWPPRPEPTLADVVLRRQPSPIRAMTRADFRDLNAETPYYRHRETYMSAAAWVVADLIARYRLRSALELGPHMRPLVTGADVMDLRAAPGLRAAGEVIVHDATVVPWPIADGAYDLFVGLQVFEHLGTAQAAAFAEVCRVARHAVVSLPIDWIQKDPTDPHHQLTEERVLSWFAPRVPTRIVIGNPAPGMRKIYVFERLDRPPVERPPAR